MKRLSKIALLVLGVGLMAVVGSFTTKQVKADADSTGGYRVILHNNNVSAPPCPSGCLYTSWAKIADDGTESNFTAVPKGRKLVITDLQFEDVSREATNGAYSTCILVDPSNSPMLTASGLGDNLSPYGNVMGSAHSETGVRMTYVPTVACANWGLNPSLDLPTVNVTLLGYLE